MPIIWLKSPNGKTIPGQAIRVVYQRRGDDLVKLKDQAELFAAGDAPHFFVSHFETCPNANEFRKAKRETNKRERVRRGSPPTAPKPTTTDARTPTP